MICHWPPSLHLECKGRAKKQRFTFCFLLHAAGLKGVPPPP